MLGVLILYVSGGTYCLNLTPNDRFFKKLFMAILLTLRVFARNLLRGNRWRNNFHISYWCLGWDSNPGFSFNKPTHYVLDHVYLYILYIRCINYIHERQDQQFKTGCEQQIFEKLFVTILFTAERKRDIFFHISLCLVMSDLGFESRLHV